MSETRGRTQRESREERLRRNEEEHVALVELRDAVAVDLHLRLEQLRDVLRRHRRVRLADDLPAHGRAGANLHVLVVEAVGVEIDEAEAERLYGLMGSGRELSGGSAGNTAAGVAALGGKAGFIGQVADDQLGAIYRHDITSLGVEFTTPARSDAGATARSLILVTPDAQRTMNTFLGAAQHLPASALDEAQMTERLVRAETLRQTPTAMTSAMATPMTR